MDERESMKAKSLSPVCPSEVEDLSSALDRIEVRVKSTTTEKKTDTAFSAGDLSDAVKCMKLESNKVKTLSK